MKSLFVVDDAENCKQEASLGIDVLRITMSELAIQKQIEDFRVGLHSIKGVKNGCVNFGFHGKIKKLVE